MHRNWKGIAAALGVVAAVGACGSGGDTGPTQSPPVIAKAPTKSGDGQTGPIGQVLPNDLRIVVTRDGQPAADVTVNWSTASGSLTPTSSQSDVDGLSASSWTLGNTAGVQTATATVSGATGSPLTFTATATDGNPPPPPPPPPSQISVTVGNNFFRSVRNATTNPAVDTVAINGVVTWTWVNTGATSHSVQSTGATSFTSSAEQATSGAIYQFTFGEAGTYTYNCIVHGNAMTGRIVVR